jgi:hypothetical protein
MDTSLTKAAELVNSAGFSISRASSSYVRCAVSDFACDGAGHPGFRSQPGKADSDAAWPVSMILEPAPQAGSAFGEQARSTQFLLAFCREP